MIVAKAAKHLARRGFEHVQQKEFRVEDISFSSAVASILGVFLAFFFIYAVVYVSRGASIILTLTALESDPKDYAPIPSEPEDESKKGLLAGKDEEDVPPPYEERPTTRVTDSLRATVRLLCKEDGAFRFPFRGMRTTIWYVLASSFLGNFLGMSVASIFGFTTEKIKNGPFDVTINTGIIIGQELATLMLANMAVVVLHAQISSAETNRAYGSGFKRVLKAPWKAAMPTLLPTTLIALSTIYSQIVLNSLSKSTIAHAKKHAGSMPKMTGCAVASTLVLFGLSVLSSMALLRIQASSFPRQDKTVVPVNFGFGMIPESDEVKVLSTCQALRSYKLRDLVRLFKMGVKLYLASIAVYGTFGVLFGVGFLLFH